MARFFYNLICLQHASACRTQPQCSPCLRAERQASRGPLSWKPSCKRTTRNTCARPRSSTALATTWSQRRRQGLSWRTGGGGRSDALLVAQYAGYSTLCKLKSPHKSFSDAPLLFLLERTLLRWKSTFFSQVLTSGLLCYDGRVPFFSQVPEIRSSIHTSTQNLCSSKVMKGYSSFSIR